MPTWRGSESGDREAALKHDDVEPGIRRFQQQTTADYQRLSGGSYRDLAHRRDVAERVRVPWVEGGPAMASTENLRVGEHSLRIRIHRPQTAAALPALVYLHGGGWVLFSIDTHDRLMREYAARSGCAVIGIDYRLAPETRYPDALEDIAAAIDWVREHGPEYGIDPARLAIGGDSAGANLAIATALRLRDRGDGHVLSGMILNYGVYDRETHPSYARYGGPEYMLTADEMAEFWHDYLGDAATGEDPLVRPMLADAAGLPPAFMCIAECDILADENRAMAARLAAAGVAVEAPIYAGATHSFLEAVSVSPLASRALDDAAAWLRARLQP